MKLLHLLLLQLLLGLLLLHEWRQRYWVLWQLGDAREGWRGPPANSFLRFCDSGLGRKAVAVALFIVVVDDVDFMDQMVVLRYFRCHLSRQFSVNKKLIVN